MLLGNIIRNRRLAAKMTLDTLAKAIESDAGNLSRIERGEMGISEVQIRKVASALNTTPASLFTESDADSPTVVGAATESPLENPMDFVHWFRSAAPYIHAFRGRTFIIAFGGEVVSEQQFIALSHDLNLLASLDVRLVLVHGLRPQVEKRLIRENLKPAYHHGLRITDDTAMEAVKEANGSMRVEIEALLSMGIANSPMAGSDIRVASGNFITAKPLGVIDGVDLQHTGEVRKIDAASIQKRLDDGELVLLSPVGYSPTGETFNLTLENVASSAAIALQAEKLIFLMDTGGVKNLRGELLREMTTHKARNLLKNANENDAPKHFPEDIEYYLNAAAKASEDGMTRTHLISRHIDGAIIQELFTASGIGTMVTELPLEAMRQATIDDLGGILMLIEPLENQGILVRRGREQIEMDIQHFYVMEHDSRIIGCASLHTYIDAKMAELACLAIDPQYRGSGRGDKLFNYCQMQAKKLGFNKLFCLTTRTEHWFLERGFSLLALEKLPKSKQALYNLQRKSKVFVKKL
ncbi:MAG TPA: amino-acid N-acetyltransferase [Methylophilaceae bacterium]|jgi:amino-acid N-acetyltransferase|nr:amino-acid N-acetyltransferase [Methylophilaceae bacterium]